MSALRSRRSELALGEFVTQTGTTVHTLTASSPVDDHSFSKLSHFVRRDALVDLRMAMHNARIGGLAHVYERGAQGNASKIADRGRMRLLSLRDGRRFVEVAISADLSSDLHEPAESCFEVYELLPTGLLLTPDLAVAGDESSQVICAFSDVPHGVARLLRETGNGTVRVSCAGRLGERQRADYRVDVI